MARVAKRTTRRAAAQDAGQSTPRKRRVLETVDETDEADRGDETDEEDARTPSKRRRAAGGRDPYNVDSLYDVPGDDEMGREDGRRVAAAETASPAKKRGPGRPRKHPVTEGPVKEAVTPSKPRRTATFATPTKAGSAAAVTTPRRNVENTPMRRSLADRSARRKSTRAYISRVVAGDDEDEDELEERIFGGEEGDDEEEDDKDEDKEEEEEEDEDKEKDNSKEKETEEEAPPPRRRGRPPKARKEGEAAAGPLPIRRGPGRPRKEHAAAREPSPPRDLPAHENYFVQHNKPSAAKTSNATLAGLRLLTHEEYFALRGGEENTEQGDSGGGHASQVQFLEELHAQSFAQWAFEMQQGFGVCLYGYGSKRHVLRAFAAALYRGGARRIVLASGWAAGSGGGGSGSMASLSASAALLRDVLGAVAVAVDGKDGLPAAVPAAEKALLGRLDDADSEITLLLDGIDAPALRRPAAQATLARVAGHARVRLLCAADTPGFALLWDGAARAALNLTFHDATTFRGLLAMASETADGPDVVDEVHALLGRRVRRVGGKDGAAFVLRSLPENARSLFQLLVGEALAAAAPENNSGPRKRGRRQADSDSDNDDDDRFDDGSESAALEYRILYNKAVEEFICSSEMAFRTLLKEFHDHQMVTSRKDAFGTEMLSLPFRRDELEALLEDLAQ